MWLYFRKRIKWDIMSWELLITLNCRFCYCYSFIHKLYILYQRRYSKYREVEKNDASDTNKNKTFLHIISSIRSINIIRIDVTLWNYSSRLFSACLWALMKITYKFQHLYERTILIRNTRYIRNSITFGIAIFSALSEIPFTADSVLIGVVIIEFNCAAHHKRGIQLKKQNILLRALLPSTYWLQDPLE